MKFLTWQCPGQLFVAQDIKKVINYSAAELRIPENPSFTFYYVGKGVDFDKDNFTFNIADQKTSYVNDAGKYMIGRTETIVMKNAEGTYQPKDKPDEARKFTPLTSVLRLDTREFGPGQMTMSSGNNMMEIDLSNPDNPIYTQGSISFAGDEDVRISVMPSTAVGVDATLNFTGNSKQGSITVKNGIKPARIYAKIIDNASTPIHVVVDEVIPEEVIPEGALPGKFTVNSSGKQVYFSKGNLQFNPSGNKWRFAENQYDGLHFAAVSDVSSEYNASYTGWIELFGWGTSNQNYGAAYYQPWSTNATDAKYGPASGDLSGMSDWGYNTISYNSLGNTTSGFRTLTNDEMSYIIERVDNRDTHLCGYGIVHEKYGLILLPDNWTGEVFTNWNTKYPSKPFSWVGWQGSSHKVGWANVIPDDLWTNMENAGAVFLPYLGTRNGDAIKYAPTLSTTPLKTRYWTMTKSPTTANAQALAFGIATTNDCHMQVAATSKHTGCAVRLVKDIPNTDGTIIIDDPDSGGL